MVASRWTRMTGIALVLVLLVPATSLPVNDEVLAAPYGEASVTGSGPAAVDGTSAAPAAASVPRPASVATGLYFEANLGQYPDHVRFAVKGAGMPAFLTDRGAGFVLLEYEEVPTDPDDLFAMGMPGEEAWMEPKDGWSVFLEFVAPPTAAEGTDGLPGYSSHFKGNDPDKWVTEAPHYARVVHEDVWPGIDVEWYGTEKGLKFDVVVAPGARPELIGFRARGATGLQVDDAGRFVIETPIADIIKDAPFTYQTDERHPVESRFRLVKGTLGIELGEHDPSLPVVVDPLIFATYLAGDARGSILHALAVDATGASYVTGWASNDYPTTAGAYDPSSVAASGNPVVVSKMAADGASLVYSTYLEGTMRCNKFGHNVGQSIDVDGSGAAYVTGWTAATDFPVTANAHDKVLNAPGPDHIDCMDAFVTKLDPTGSSLIYSSYLGGIGREESALVASGPSGKAYVTGLTRSADFPATGSAFQSDLAGSADAYFSVIDASGSGDLIYSTFLGGSSTDEASSVAVDARGDAYIAGVTGSNDFPVTATAYQPLAPGKGDGFVTRLDVGRAGLLGLVYSTYLGGSLGDRARDIAVHHGHAFVTGSTYSDDFPVTADALFTKRGRQTDAFVVELNMTLPILEYGTIFGSVDHPDAGYAIDLDDRGLVYVAGTTDWKKSASEAIPTTPDAIDDCTEGLRLAFIAILSTTYSRLVHSTCFGGHGALNDARDIAAGPLCAATWLGGTYASGLATSGAYDESASTGPGPDGYVARMFACPPPPVAGVTWAPAPVCHNRPLTLTFTGASGHPAYPLVEAQWILGDGTSRTDAPVVSSFTHTYATPGTYLVSVRVEDIANANATAIGAVEAINCAPTMAPLDEYVIHEGEHLTFGVTTTDPNSDPLERTTWGVPDGASFWGGVFEWTPLQGQKGIYFVTFLATDPYGATASQTAKITVLAKEELQATRHVPSSSDVDGDGMPDSTEACPAEATATGGCGVVVGELLEQACRDISPRPDTARAAWEAGSVRVAWTHDTPCPIDAYLVWNGTADLIAVLPPNVTFVLDKQPWQAPHRYHIQGILAGQGHVFDRGQARATNVVQAPFEDAAGPAVIDPEETRPIGALGEMVGVHLKAPLVPSLLTGFLVAGLLLAAWYASTRAGWLRLFSRIKDHEVLDHPLRAEIAALVAAEPGIHLKEIERRTGRGYGTVRHHLRILVEARALRRRRGRGYTCYYPPEMQDRSLEELAALLQSDVAKRLIRLVAQRPGASVAAIAKDLGIDASTARYHLKRFEGVGLSRIDGCSAFPGERTDAALAAFG